MAGKSRLTRQPGRLPSSVPSRCGLSLHPGQRGRALALGCPHGLTLTAPAPLSPPSAAPRAARAGQCGLAASRWGSPATDTAPGHRRDSGASRAPGHRAWPRDGDLGPRTASRAPGHPPGPRDTPPGPGTASRESPVGTGRGSCGHGGFGFSPLKCNTRLRNGGSVCYVRYITVRVLRLVAAPRRRE